MVETCLAEYEIDNPFLFEALFPHVAKRSRHIKQAGETILWYRPERGQPPKWTEITKRLVRISEVIADLLDGPQVARQLKEKRFPEVVRHCLSILQAVRYMQKQMALVPLEQARLVLTKSGYIEIELAEERSRK